MSELKDLGMRRLPPGERPGSLRRSTESQLDTTESSLQDMYEDVLKEIYRHLDTVSQYEGDDESFEIAETWLDNLSATLECWHVDACASESFPLMKNSWLGTEIESCLLSINEQLTCDTTALRKVIFTDSFQRGNLNPNLRAADMVSDKVATPPSQVNLATEAMERLQGFVRKVWQFLAAQNPPVGPYKKLKSQIDERFRQVSDSYQSPRKQNRGTDGSNKVKEPPLGEEEVLAIAPEKPPESTHHPSQVRGSTDFDYRGAVESRPSLTQVPAPAESPTLLTAPKTKPIGAPQQTRLEDMSNSLESQPSSLPDRPPLATDDVKQQAHSTLPSQTSKPTSMDATAEPRVTAFDVFFEGLTDDRRHSPAIQFGNLELWRKDHRLANFLEDQALVFIVDTSKSMLAHWSEAMFLLHCLIVKSWAGNPHSVAVLLSRPFEEIRVRKWSINEDLQELRIAMKDLKARTVGLGPYLNFDLSYAFEDWLYAIWSRTPSRAVDFVTPAVVILTDSKWKDTTFFRQIREIANLYHRQIRRMSERPGYLFKSQANMTIIKFGEDLGANKIFRRFEDVPRADGDFMKIHTEPSNGDIYRMLLGKLADDHNDHENPSDGKVSRLLDVTLKGSSPPIKADAAGPIAPGG